ncbi:site-specific integrase [Latilactobacillus sakei]|uniref:site-specific integrase n=1 Tax=Latilactobacillus sakei TaxID=1599 RepID=UPI000DC64612|nr:site-specific integrase [Latilactobacillus sakei]SPS07294.1 Tyrosine recombinase XerD [Latilactobacillus sakei]
MAKIRKYEKNGQEFYMFQAYLGINPQTGKEKRTTRRGFKTRKEARLALSTLELQADSGQLDQQPINLTFEDVYKQWYSSYINTVRESTWNRTAGMFNNHILPALGKYRIRTITVAQCQQALNKWFKATSRNYKRWFNYVQAVFDYAIKRGYITDNPATKVTMPKKADTWGDKQENFWDKNQLKQFFALMDPSEHLEQYTLFRVLAFTGVRRGECLALTWDDLDTQKGTLSINKTLTQGAGGKQIIQATKTKKGNRIISLDKQTLFYLRKWQMDQKRIYFMLGFNTSQPSQLIFATTKNTFKSLNTPSKWLRRLTDGTSLPKITVHGFRHTHASALFSAGASIKEVQERLGHEDAQTTLNIYTHVTNSQNKEAVQKLAQFLNF